MNLTRNQTSQPANAVPTGLADVAYIDGAACAAAGAMSISQFHDLVRNGKAPQPVIRKPRFTRWLMSDIRNWLISYRDDSDFEKDSAAVKAKASTASKAARAKEAAGRQIQQVAA